MAKKKYGLNFPLLISGPKEIPITAEQHSKLSYMGLGNFMITYPIAIEDKKDEVVLYCHDWKANELHDNPEFAEVIPGRINTAAELGYFNIPKTTKLYKKLSTEFKHLFFKK